MTSLEVNEGGVRIEVAECDLDSDADIALEDAAELLDDGERARADGFVFRRDRERFTRAHGHLRRRLGLRLGAAPREVRIVAPEGRKPYLAAGDIRFNLSHSGRRAVVAITGDAEIGVDLELIDRMDRLGEQLDGLADFCLTGREREALSSTPAAGRVRRFLSYWTAKEARMKLTGEGMALEPRSIALALQEGAPVGYLRPRAPEAHLRFVQLAHQDAICCVAYRATEKR